MAIVTALITALVPESKIKNAYKTLCSLVVVFALFSSVSGIRDIDTDLFSDYGERSETLKEKEEELLVEEGERMLDRMLENKLYEGGIEAEVKTEMSIEAEVLTAKRIYIYGTLSDEEKERGKEIISNTVKEECEVIFARRNDVQ